MIKNRREGGQSLVIIAIAFLGLVAVAALIIDGGSLYLNRRTAQTAADAAAMAGAHEKCVNNGNLSAVQTVATQFATENHATTVESVTIDADGAVVVQTVVETSSFFARILGYENNTVRAIASAACFAPGATEKLLPISWACQPPIGGVPGSTCTIDSIPWTLFKEQILPIYKNDLHENGTLLLDQPDGTGTADTYANGIGGKMPYLIMDSSTQTTTICAPPFGSGTVNCDWDGDGTPNLSGGGDRGWLALDGTGASSLSSLIVNGYPNPLALPQWFPTENGAASSVFIQAKGQIEDKVALVPVYNAFCVNTTSSTLPTDCVAQGYESTDQVAPGAGNKTFYRVAGFAPFVVTCISSKPNEKCPVKTFAGFTTGPLKQVLTIEGYFVSGYVAGTGIDPDGFDLGVYIISLTK